MINIRSSPLLTVKTIGALCVAIGLLATVGCRTTSEKGGYVTLDEEFTVSAPAMTTIKQGDTSHVPVTLRRGAYFKRDVDLTFKTSTGLTLNPRDVTVKASDQPVVEVQVAVAREAALGEYRINVTATPATGKPTATVFVVKVAAQ